MGTQANELSMGCDCLGQIHYLVGLSECLQLLSHWGRSLDRTLQITELLWLLRTLSACMKKMPGPSGSIQTSVPEGARKLFEVGDSL
jgi:hypothetical protein